MSSALRIFLVISLALVPLAGCLTRAKAPIAAGPSSEYQAALAKIVRVPQPHPLLDEGTVPLRALEIVAAYQDIARRGKYRELARFFDSISQTTQKDFLESRQLRREVEHGPALEVLRDVVRYRDDHGVRYEFQFESIQRAQTRTRYLNFLETSNGGFALVSDGS